MSAKTTKRRKQRASARKRSAKAPQGVAAPYNDPSPYKEQPDPRKLPPMLPPLAGGGYDTA